MRVWHPGSGGHTHAMTTCVPTSAISLARRGLRRGAVAARDDVRAAPLPLPVVVAAASFFSLIIYLTGAEPYA
jgi:hypothetical protein